MPNQYHICGQPTELTIQSTPMIHYAKEWKWKWLETDIDPHHFYEDHCTP